MSILYHQNFIEGQGTFYAIDNGREVSHLITDFSDNFYPYVLSMHTLKEYQNKGIMENLLKRANNFYWHFSFEKLRSDKPETIGFWKRLEEKGLVEKVKDESREDFGRWIFK